MIKIKCRNTKKVIKMILMVSVFLSLTGCNRQSQGEILWDSQAQDELSQEFGQQMTEITEMETITEIENTIEQQTLFVHVCGAVMNPAVYELPVGSRIYEAISIAGGMLPQADQSYINLAEVLQDGQQIQVPTVAETQILTNNMTIVSSKGKEQSEDGKVNINTASKQELTSITGIGDSRAEAIISYREAKGGFGSIEDIKKVDGIKEGLFSKIKNSIKVK